MVCYVKLYQRITLVERVNENEEDPEMKDRKKKKNSRQLYLKILL